MANAAYTTAYYNGQILHYISDLSISRLGGGDQEEIRGITPTNRALGWRKGQKASHKISFKVPVTEGSQEVRWDSLQRSKTEFTFQVSKADINTLYCACVVDSCEESVDARRDTNWAVTISALYDQPVV